MRRIFLETARRIELAESIDTLWRHLISGTQSVGIDNILYMSIADQPPFSPFIKSTLPEDYPRMAFDNPDFVEPFLAHCCATFEVTKMGVEFLPDHVSYLEDSKQEYIRRMTKFDFRAALGIPCQLVGTGRHGGFVMGNAMNSFEFERNILPLASELQSLSLIADNRIRTIQSAEDDAAGMQPLSAREHETMELISNGMRPKEVAHTMGISEASVRLYLKNARVKLYARTKEEAVAKFIADPKRG